MSLSLRQLAWKWIETKPEFMPNELGRELDISNCQTRSVIDCLVKKGCVTAIKTKTKPYVFQAVEGANPSFTRDRPNPHKRTCGRQRIWKSMVWRGKSRFFVSDIADATGVSVSNVRRYISDLVSYGYINRLSHARGGRPASFIMLICSGANYPQITKKGLYDPNRKITILKGSSK